MAKTKGKLVVIQSDNEEQLTYQKRRYFKDVSQVKAYVSLLIFDYANGRISESKYRALLYGVDRLLKCTDSEYFQRGLGPLEERMKEIEDLITAYTNPETHVELE